MQLKLTCVLAVPHSESTIPQGQGKGTQEGQIGEAQEEATEEAPFDTRLHPSHQV